MIVLRDIAVGALLAVIVTGFHWFLYGGATDLALTVGPWFVAVSMLVSGIWGMEPWRSLSALW